MRTLLLYILLSSAAVAQPLLVEPWHVVDLITGDFGMKEYDSKAMLVGAEGSASLYIFEDPFYPGPEGYSGRLDFEIDMHSELPTLHAGQGWFDVTSSAEHFEYGQWTETARISFIDGAFAYVGYIYDFIAYSDGESPSDGINCSFDFVAGTVVVTTQATEGSESVVSKYRYAVGPVVLRSKASDPLLLPDLPEIAIDQCPV